MHLTVMHETPFHLTQSPNKNQTEGTGVSNAGDRHFENEGPI